MKRVYSTSDILTDRERKNLLILETIRREGRVSKTEISKITRLNIVTVSNYINHFLNNSLVAEKGLDVSAGGRRPVLLELNPQTGYVIGLGLSMTDMVGVITDLSGKVYTDVKREKPHIVATRSTPLSQESAEAIINGLMEVVEELLEKSKLDISKIKGLGIGIPGLIDEQGQTIRWTSRIGKPGKWGPLDVAIALPVRDLFERRFDIPTFIENDATVAAFGVRWLGLEPEIKDVLYMYSGVGSGIIVNGEIYRGISGGAGELSIYDPYEGEENGKAPKDEAEFWHILKQDELDLGITARVKEAISKGRESLITQLVDGNIEKIDIHIIIKAAKDGDSLAGEMIEKAAERLGIKVAFLVNFLNPEIVVIGGGIEAAGSLVLDPIKKMVKRCVFEEMGSAVRIVPSRLGDRAVALGAACLVIQSVFAHA